MLLEIGAALGAAKTGVSLVKDGVSLTEAIKKATSVASPDMKAVNSLIIDLQNQLIQAQSNQVAIQQHMVDLAGELQRLSSFHEEAKRYELTTTDMNAQVYALKNSDNIGEPMHYLCTACYQKSEKSILQPVDFNTLGCPNCSAKFLKADGRSGAMVSSTGRNRTLDGY